MIYLAMHNVGKAESLHNLLSAPAALVIVLIATVIQVSCSEELGMMQMNISIDWIGFIYLYHTIRINFKLFLCLGEPINQRDARFIPLSNVLESINDADSVRIHFDL